MVRGSYEERAEEDEGDEVGDRHIETTLRNVAVRRLWIAHGSTHTRQHDPLPTLSSCAPDNNKNYNSQFLNVDCLKRRSRWKAIKFIDMGQGLLISFKGLPEEEEDGVEEGAEVVVAVDIRR